MLGATADPQQIEVGGTSQITADTTVNSNDENLDFGVPSGTTPPPSVDFAAQGGGSVSPQQAEIENGTAQTTFTPDSAGGSSVEATLDTETVTAAVIACTIVGTGGNDDLQGTPDKDVICGLGGDDTISGKGGNDLLFGQSGADTLNGGPGVDGIGGGPGDDDLEDGEENSIMVGGAGSDLILGKGGLDVANGGAGNDALGGGAGNDFLRGAGTPDIVVGGDGEDRVFGDGSNDLLNTVDGAGDDEIDGGAGNGDFCNSDGGDTEDNCEQGPQSSN